MVSLKVALLPRMLVVEAFYCHNALRWKDGQFRKEGYIQRGKSGRKFLSLSGDGEPALVTRLINVGSIAQSRASGGR
jgi:hypothetical protein